MPVYPKPKRRLRMQIDELSSLVNHYRQQAVGLGIGWPHPLSKSAFILESATGHPLAVCGSRGIGFTVNVRWSEHDLWSAYVEVLPGKRQRAVGKETGWLLLEWHRSKKSVPLTTF